jgi:hypothetical protein
MAVVITKSREGPKTQYFGQNHTDWSLDSRYRYQIVIYRISIAAIGQTEKERRNTTPTNSCGDILTHCSGTPDVVFLIVQSQRARPQDS